MTEFGVYSIGGGKFPNMVDKIEFFEKAFDHARARKEGTIIPQAGVNEDYDEAERGVNMVKQQLEEYLQKQRKRMGSKVRQLYIHVYNIETMHCLCSSMQI